ncbi:hypothetical protein OPV22_009657 [Ensete ventricosum]|uniref:GDSL esterase/lipase n=1 Tax=Ensete ventricosum TaxID=4639 RepID=A0AAV8PS18_ENSVE|nr:hypothetical protein OPV22_009657 [Ensete ventricosum]
MEKRIAFAATFILYVIFSLAHPLAATGGLNITAVFAFGDSTLDAGNNNHLHTLFRADYAPYGRDLPTHRPSGRLITDFLVSSLGLKKLLPPYSASTSPTRPPASASPPGAPASTTSPPGWRRS